MELERLTRTTLTMKEIVEYLGVSYWLVTQLVKRKQIPCSRVGGKVYIENPRKYLMNTLNVSINTVTKIHKELNSVGLIKDVWDDVGKPNIVYIK